VSKPPGEGLEALRRAFDQGRCFQCGGPLFIVPLVDLGKHDGRPSVYIGREHEYDAKRCLVCETPVVVHKDGSLAFLGDGVHTMFFARVHRAGEPTVQ
jgi:hypothetical protein